MKRWCLSNHLDWVTISAHFLVCFSSVIGCSSSSCTLHTLVAEHDTIKLLWHVYCVITGLPLLLICLTLFAITVLVVAGGTSVHWVFFFFKSWQLRASSSLSCCISTYTSTWVHLLLDHVHDCPRRRRPRTVLVEQVKHNWLVDSFLEELVIHDKHTSIWQEHHSLEDIFQAHVHSTTFISHNLTCSWLHLALLCYLAAARP